MLEIALEKQINSDNEFFEIAPLVQRQISYAVLNFKSGEKMKLNTKFYKTIRNIAKIIETQYELSYIIPIIGEIIDTLIYRSSLVCWMPTEKIKIISVLDLHDSLHEYLWVARMVNDTHNYRTMSIDTTNCY